MERRVKLSFAFLVLALLLAFLFLPSGKSQSNHFGCYSDALCRSTLSSIDWGTLHPGESVTKSFYVKNLDDARLSGLSFSMVEVVPDRAENYLRLDSSVGSSSLRKNDYSEVELTLNVDPLVHDIANFSFDVVVTASFSESSDGGVDGSPPSGFGGWEGSDTDFSDSVEIPSEESEGMSGGQRFALFLAVAGLVYLFLGKK